MNRFLLEKINVVQIKMLSLQRIILIFCGFIYFVEGVWVFVLLDFFRIFSTLTLFECINCVFYLFIHFGETFTVLFSSIDSFWTIKGARECSNSTKPHLTRCDMYYKCTVMPSGNVVWVPQNCSNGLVYDTKYLNCVIPGEQK